ncbi:TetR/AcrR family transcriptional regulator [bacterium]|nr:TetR/AcrR family transcriptional regulator [bacterium]
MRQTRKKISKENIIEATLEMINERGTSNSVTIRDIATKMGCSHPNIYNYYQSLDLLRWDCLEAVMIRMVETVMDQVSLVEIDENKMKCFFDCLLDFYIGNRGWYSLIWFDQIGGPIPDKVKQVIVMPRKQFCLFLEECFPGYNLSNLAEEVTDTVHSYIHGQMAKYVTGRSFFPDLKVLKEKVVKTAMEIIYYYLAKSIDIREV